MIIKKGFIGLGFGVIFILILGVIFLALGIWFSFRIDDMLSALSPVATFIQDKWWIIALFIAGIVWHAQIAAIVNKILGWVGIKV